VTSTASGFRLASDKLDVVGQGIDTAAFVPPAVIAAPYRRTVISIGRITPSKNVGEMVRAIGMLRSSGIEASLEIIGAPFTGSDQRYEQHCRAIVRAEGLEDTIIFHGAVPHSRVHHHYHRGGVFLNLGETRSLDKALLEAMASHCVPVSRNESFIRLMQENGLERLVPLPGPRGVADTLAKVISMPPDERRATTRQLRHIVVEQHNLDHLLDNVIGQLNDLVGAGPDGRRPSPSVTPS
jgi:glycosyltransferase involved in cell wall biosynthesis